MRGMLALVIGMGVLIVVGVAVVATTIIHRMVPGAAIHEAKGPMVDAVLDEAPGTRITGSSASGDRIAVTLQGGGPDRVVIVDLASGKRLGGVRLRQ